MTSDAKIKQSGFKIEKVDLAKPAVLEASAGTGKTYSLTGLVIRLLIGHKCLPLDLEHILLVTFTEAATADLRRKVLEKIISVREAFELSMLLESADLQSISSVDPFALILLRELFDSKNGKFTEEIKSCLNDWINSLKIAERKIDKATISTIHSFCQNMLKRNAFESGVLFKNKFIDSEDELNTEALVAATRNEFYKKNLGPLDILVWQNLISPTRQDQILREFENADRIVPDISEYSADFKLALEKLRAAVKFYFLPYKNMLPADFDSTVDSLDQQELKNICKDLNCHLAMKKSMKLSAVARDKTRNVTAFLLQVDPKIDLSLIEQKTVKTQPDYTNSLEIPLAEGLAEYTKYEQSLLTLWFVNHFGEASKIKGYLKKLKNQMSFDDLITNLRDSLDESLHGTNALLLASRIRDIYPVAMIDEFQDTDKRQFDIFSSIYMKGPSLYNIDGYPCSIFLIGDPKQSIYRFRNADINTYFSARERNEQKCGGAYYNMDINFRSTPECVRSVNEFFSDYVPADNADENNSEEDCSEDQLLPVKAAPEAQSSASAATLTPAVARRTFRTGAINFLPVGSRTKNTELVWNENGEIRPAAPVIYTDLADLFIPEEMACINAPKQKSILSNICAFQINRMLTRAAFRNVKTGELTALRLSDIAVLVSSQFEASAVQKSLLEYGIRSVYLSDRDTILTLRLERDFITDFMEALLFIRDSSKVKHLVVNPTLHFSLEEINKVVNDSVSYNSFLELCGRCLELWETRGFMAALYNFINDQSINLFDRIRRFDNAEKVITNILHIAESVQTQETKESTPFAVYSWFTARTAEELGESETSERNANKLRLDSEDDLISIVTIFKSKGLEYPIVFMPYIGMEKQFEQPVKYHENAEKEVKGKYKQGQSIATLNLSGLTSIDKLGSENFLKRNLYNQSEISDSEKKTIDECLQEQARLLYVAMTRARFCNCFVIPSGSKFKSPAALNRFVRDSILGATLQGRFQGCGVEELTLSELWSKYLALMERNIKNSPDYNPDRPVYETIGDPDTDLGIFMNGLKFSSQSVELSGSAAELLNPDDYAPAEFNGSIDRSWAITSYSNLMGRGIRKTRKYSLQTEQPGHNDENDAAPDPVEQTQQPEKLPYVMNQFTFPKGSKPGDFLHGMMEKRDFQYQLDEQRQKVDPLYESLEAYIERIVKKGFFADSRTLRHWREPDGIAALTGWFKNIVDTPLVIGDGSVVHLSDIPMQDRLAEAEFLFRLGELRNDRVNDFYQKYYGKDLWLQAVKDYIDRNAEREGEDQLNSFAFDRVNGFVTGKIDLIFLYQGKYYILDYKSNHLGDRPEDYSRLNMAMAVAEHRYDFQYSIYALALYRHLKARIPNLDFSRVFGGVIYLFIRGCSAASKVMQGGSADSLGNGTVYGCYDVKLPYISRDNSFIEELDSLFSCNKGQTND